MNYIIGCKHFTGVLFGYIFINFIVELLKDSLACSNEVRTSITYSFKIHFNYFHIYYLNNYI